MTPIDNLLIPFLGKRSIIKIEEDGPDLLLLVDIFQYLQIVSIKEVHFPLKGLHFSPKLIKALTHKLYTIVTKVTVLLGIDLRWMEDEDRSDVIVLFDLFDERCVVE